jgi:hypothetical protein
MKMKRDLPRVDRFDIEVNDAPLDKPYMQLNPRSLRRPNNPQECAPGYLWNSTTQELIPILPEDHPDYRQNQEIIIKATRRWDQGTSK